MGRVLIVTEKPSARANFVTALGGASGRFEGQEFMIVNLAGHVMELADPSKQVPAAVSEKYRRWDLQNLPWHESDFSWKKQVTKGKSDFVLGVKKAAASCDEIAMACDVDPYGEGQLLCGEVLEHLGLTRGKRLTRVYHMDETPDEVRRAFRERKPVPDLYKDREFVMATVRERWDFLSMQFTRIATACCGGKYILRNGRLKSAMVVLVGDQLARVEAYKKVPSYENRFKDENGNVFSNPKEPRFPKRGQVPNVYHGSSVVVDKETVKHTAPPKLIDQAALSSQMEPMGFPAPTVLKVYQDMYQAGLCSYPRTEDKFVSPGQFDEMLPLVDAIARVVGVDPRILTHRVPRKTHVQSGGAHGANRPGKKVPPSLDWVESNYGKCGRVIYEILGRNYLAMLCEDYEYLAQAGHVADYPDFKGTSTIPRKPGWKVIYHDGWSEESLAEGDGGKGFGKTASPFVYEGFPPKPAAPTQKWLMKELEKRDVGTPATRVSTYSDVTSTKAKYPLLKTSRGKLAMADCGQMNYILLKGTRIGSLDLTERVYGQIRGVADGTFSMKACLGEVEKLVVSDMGTMRKNAEALWKGMGDKMGSEGNFEQAERFSGTWAKTGQEVSPKRVYAGHRFTDAEVQKLLAGEEIQVECQGQKGPYTVKGILDNCTYNGHTYVGFSRTGFAGEDKERFSGTWNGKEVHVKRVWGGHEFTEKEIADLLAGKDITFECKGKNGAYEVTGCLADCEYNGHKYVGFQKK